ncbi:5-oxoprolinase subunit C family protein [Blastococcus atacamensis]|uniref:5-oxoprolinase subunit C family protein n=1 Tax=Blastococcus atacamensis TaxID=2070508 RepID=UPI001E5E51D5|nr:biotin-dependent carboxyltransferase family protein [Blastococcus atacamensis]
MTRAVTVLAPGPSTTVQDEGRPGQASLGIGRSGACDRASYRLANRLVGNAPGAAALEVTFGGLALRAEHDLVVVTTGAPCPGSPAHNAPELLPAGSELRLGAPTSGLRTYVAIRGGFLVPPVLGSRSTDVLSGLGPPPLSSGDVLPVGAPDASLPGVDVAPVADPPAGELAVRVLPGPRLDWFADEAWTTLTGQPYTVTSESNRVGVRLDGLPLDRRRTDELPSEGMVRGALQIPPSGRPVLFLADHPVTGGYPVVGYVADDDVDRCAQLRPGQALRFRTGQPG